MSLLSEESLLSTVAIPVSIPQVEIPAESPGLPIAQFQLNPGQLFSVPYLCLHFVGYTTRGYLDRRSTGLPAVYVGLYYQPIGADTPTARPTMHVGLDAPGLKRLDAFDGIFTQPGTYRFLLVNNHASSSISAVVTGVAYGSNIT